MPMIQPTEPNLGGHPATDMVDRIARETKGHDGPADKVSLGEVIATFGRRSFLPVLMLPALLVVSPLSGIPLFSSICGLAIALISAQMLIPGRDTLWLPRALAERKISGQRAQKVLPRLYGIADRLDRHARVRLAVLVEPPGRYVVECACLVAGLCMPLMEILPFTSSALGVSILLMATGLLARDGVFAGLGLILMPVILGAVITTFITVAG